ncbi:helicase-related protein [Kocuria massiliensis]|uniref:helicase-related protein n=1 Tax=Kocuria massiliensis TaxID=1926282 RepID=UPI0022B96504|nr:helicase-related protein [Kocuria massiliensis]
MSHEAAEVAPGSLVEIRDETWLVTSVENTADGDLLTVSGVSPLVEGTTARFYSSIDSIRTFSPKETRIVADTSSRYVDSRLWLEATLRKTPLPVSQQELAVTPHVLADTLAYQREAVSKALDPNRLRSRLLIADTVGLGKTLEIGMILSELIRRGKGRRILIVTPRHVLEQMQHEMWTRFAIPFVRLDSEGVQQVKQKLPATRNPFTFFERVIISMDTLKQDRFVQDLRKHRWDAVVIDESHNVTNRSTQNNQLARTLAPNTDSLILASATPHNGRNDSFAQQLTLLEPSSVGPEGPITQEAVSHLMIRRHRNSASVKAEVGDRWAERLPPRNILATPSPEELAVARDIAATWTHPASGNPPGSGKGYKLFPWTLAKSFLSSPAALRETVTARLKSLDAKPDAAAERQALERLQELNDACLPESGLPLSGKYSSLLEQLREKKISKNSPERAVVFAERVPTLTWLRDHLIKDLKLKDDQVQILHGGLTDMEQQAIVESFKQASSPIRVLVTGDVASEGVNLHQQCHELIHYDIPWSLIRIEQRNGRIDRYGQEHPPQITTLLLDLDGVGGFTGDIRILSRLLEREREAHEKLGDTASIMGKYDASAEEDEIIQVLRGAKDFDETVPAAEQSQGGDDIMDLLLGLSAEPEQATAKPEEEHAVDLDHPGLFKSASDFLLAGLERIYTEPNRSPETGGVNLQVERSASDVVQTISLTPSADLRQRLQSLPQSYLAERGVLDQIRLTPERGIAERRLRAALSDTQGSSWPDTHYLAPLHPILDWVSDRALATLDRGQVFAIRGDVENLTVLMMATMTNKRGENITVSFWGVEFLMGWPTMLPFDSPDQMFAKVGLSWDTLGRSVREPEQFQHLIPEAVTAVETYVESDSFQSAIRDDAEARASRWIAEVDAWMERADDAAGKQALFKDSRATIQAQRQLAQEMVPDRSFIRPILVVVPREGE